MVFLPPFPIWPKCHFGQVDLTQSFWLVFFLLGYHGTKWPIINLTISQLSHHYLRYDLCHMSSLYYIFEGDVASYVAKGRWVDIYLYPIYNHTFTMCMYIVYMTTYRFYTHDLPKFEPKTSWRHFNAFAIKLHHHFLMKGLQLFVLSF